MAYPIWKDYYVTLPSTPCSFRIKVGTSVIYTGTAVKRPDQTSNQVRINDICSDYISNSLPLLPNPSSLPVTFVIETLSGSTWSTLATVQFFNDWSYDVNFAPTTAGFSHPVIPVVVDGQLIPYTKKSTASVDITLSNGEDEETATMGVATTPSRLTDTFIRDLTVSGWGGVCYNSSLSYYTHIHLPLAPNSCKVVTCGVRYVLYYINAYGGMDWFPILGNAKSHESVERTVVESDASNTNRSRSRREMQNTSTRGITLHTGWLKDEQSAMMHHLLDSTSIYLHDLDRDVVEPVLITSTSHEYATFANNGHKPVEYTIEVEYANKQIRK